MLEVRYRGPYKIPAVFISMSLTYVELLVCDNMSPY